MTVTKLEDGSYVVTDDDGAQVLTLAAETTPDEMTAALVALQPPAARVLGGLRRFGSRLAGLAG